MAKLVNENEKSKEDEEGRNVHETGSERIDDHLHPRIITVFPMVCQAVKAVSL
jgi:hypothetical protein